MKNFWFIFWVLLIAWGIVSNKVDTSDYNFWHRSNMRIHVDNLTGCHYLSTGHFGGLVPRLDEYGDQVCTGYEFK